MTDSLWPVRCLDPAGQGPPAESTDLYARHDQYRATCPERGDG
ncbi:hypothetical protein [Catellatospora citrea]|nr:hypothetical protein [Catellatospora citrea]